MSDTGDVPMKRQSQILPRLGDNRGVTATIVALSMAAFIGFTALAIDIGYVMVTRNELQNVADSSALAAAGELGHLYGLMSYTQQKSYICDPAGIRKVAKDIAEKNGAAGINVVINDDDVIIGKWIAKDKNIEPDLNQPDAVKITARRDDFANNPITTFFVKIFGTDTIAVTAGATAALTGQSTIEEGELIPIGISSQWFEGNFCGQPIKFHPTNDPESCAGWNTYDMTPSSDSKLRKDIIIPMTDTPPTFTPPSASTGDYFSFTGGDLSNETFDAFQALFDKMKYIDGDGDDTAWTTSVVVYASDSCDNPNKSIEIAGFAKAVITEVDVDTKTIIADVECGYIDPGRGGGAEYGTKGTIPGLVE